MWTSLTISCFIACHCLLWREAARRRSFYHCLYEHLPCLFEEEQLCARPLLSLVHIRIIHCLGEELLWEFLDIVYAGVDHWLFWRGITIPTIDCVSKGLLSGDLVAPSVRSFVVCVEEDLLRDPPPLLLPSPKRLPTSSVWRGTIELASRSVIRWVVTVASRAPTAVGQRRIELELFHYVF